MHIRRADFAWTIFKPTDNHVVRSRSVALLPIEDSCEIAERAPSRRSRVT